MDPLSDVENNKKKQKRQLKQHQYKVGEKVEQQQ